MSSSPRGFALVISNVTFDPGAAPDLDPRRGGEVDDEVLRKVFTELDYIVTVHRDLTAQVRTLQDVLWNVKPSANLLINLKKGSLGSTEDVNYIPQQPFDQTQFGETHLSDWWPGVEKGL